MADVEIDLETTNSKELMCSGIRAFAIGDFANAAAAFGRASQLMAQEHGDEHDTLGEVYLQYARALLEVSREESEPLGDAIPRGESDSDDDDDEAAEEEVEEVTEATNGQVSSTENQIEKKEEIPHQNGNSEKEIGESSGTNDKDDKNEDCTDLQLAWEVLEVAKKIFTNRGDTGRERLAETLILLGEVAMESENFNDAVEDIKRGIDLQKTVYESTSRKLAESYYKLGTAYSTISKIDEAIESFELSIETLKKRIESLETNLDDKAKTERQDEIKEIKALVPEIEEKINDTKSIKDELAAKLLNEMTIASKSNKNEPVPSSSTSVNDISHLVKRKRKLEEEEDGTETNEAEPVTKKIAS